MIRAFGRRDLENDGGGLAGLVDVIEASDDPILEIRPAVNGDSDRSRK